jgi:hypothetical protein
MKSETDYISVKLGVRQQYFYPYGFPSNLLHREEKRCKL